MEANRRSEESPGDRRVANIAKASISWKHIDMFHVVQTCEG